MAMSLEIAFTTPSEMAFKTGEIVLLRFPFTDGEGSKKRPALVLLDNLDGDVLLARITSKLYSTPFDLAISNWKSVGLLLPSCIRLHKMATLELTLIERSLGELSILERAGLITIFQLLIKEVESRE